MYQEKAMHYREKKRSKALVLFLTVDVCICICILLAAWAVFLKEPQAAALVPDIAPAEVEPNQTPLIEESSSSKKNTDSANSNGANNGNNRVNLKYSDQVIISIADNTVSLNFGNGSRSTMDMMMQLVVQEQILAQTARLTPGNQVEKLNLKNGIAELLSEGIYEGQFRVYYFDQETGETSDFNTNVPITVTVQY